MPRWLIAFLGLGLLLSPVAIYILFFGRSYINDGPSMEPTIFNGDRFLIDGGEDPEIGDIVVVMSPLYGTDIVKRVVALAGDTVEESDGRLIVNGVETHFDEVPCPPGAYMNRDEEPDYHCNENRIADVSFLTADSNVNFFRSTPQTVVPEGHVWLRGDHRDRSNDSLNPMMGAVPIVAIRGVVVLEQ